MRDSHLGWQVSSVLPTNCAHLASLPCYFACLCPGVFQCLEFCFLHLDSGVHYEASEVCWKAEFPVSRRRLSFNLFGSPWLLTWSRGGYVQSFRLKIGVKQRCHFTYTFPDNIPLRHINSEGRKYYIILNMKVQQLQYCHQKKGFNYCMWLLCLSTVT